MMVFDKKKLGWRICSFLLILAIICNISTAAVLGAADTLNDILEESANSSDAVQTTDTAQTTPPQADTADTDPQRNYQVMPLADDEDGIDLYTQNGKFLTILGDGLYATENHPSLSFGALSYTIKITNALTEHTVLRVSAGVKAEVALLAVNSTYLTLILEDNAKLDLTINGDCGFSVITLGNGAELTMMGDSLDFDALTFDTLTGGVGSKLTIDTLAVSLTENIEVGTAFLTDMILTGTADSHITAVSNMTLDNVQMHADENALAEISSKGDLTVQGSETAIKAVKIGIADGGEGTVSLKGIGTLEPEILGAFTSGAKAYPANLDMTIKGTPTANWDYTITYQNYGADGYEIWTPASNVPVVYRVQKIGSNATIVGYHTGEGYISADAVPLTAQALRMDYEFRVWSLTAMAENADNADDKTTSEWLSYDGKVWDEENKQIVEAASPIYDYTQAQITSTSGNVILYAVYVPENVIVQLHTNMKDAQDVVFAVFPAYVGAKGMDLRSYLSADELQVQGHEAQTFADAPENGNAIVIANYRVTKKDADGITDLYTVWSAGHILVTYKIPEFFAGYQYEYQDAEGNWQPIAANSLDELNAQLTLLIGTLDIYYGETYGKLPLLRCVKPVGQDGVEYAFVGWYISSLSGGKIMLDEDTVVSAETTTANALTTGTQIISALFENTRYVLTVPASLGKWQFLDQNGSTIAFTDNGDNTISAYVNSDTVITMKRADETTVSAYWRLTNMTDSSLIWPSETPSSAGGSYWLTYTFTMPKANVRAVYDETVRWDTAMGDYVFDTYQFNGHESYGFQILDRATGNVLHQFRWILNGSTTTVYFTSSEATDHQIKLDTTTKLYLDGVQLTARDDVVDKLSGFYSSDIYSSTLVLPEAAAYHNIYIDNKPEADYDYKASTNATITITLLRDSTIFSIGQKAWINHHMHNLSPTYRSTMVINGGGNALDIYSYLIHGGTTFNHCVINVLRSGNETADETLHWYHTDSGSDVITGCTIDANGRSLFSRLGGSMAGYGNAVTFKINGGTKITNLDSSYTSWLSLDNVHMEADRILSFGYGFYFSNSTIKAKIIGYHGAIHTTYTNSISSFDNCDITVTDWMSVSRPGIYGGTTLTVAGGFHLYESLRIYGDSTVTVGSFERFKTTAGNSGQDNTHYAGTDANHYFYVDIYGGSDLIVNGDIDIGVNHSSMPEIKVYGAGTTVSIGGNADIINTLRIYDGAQMTVAGDLTLHQDLEVKSAGTKLSVEGNLYHVTTGKGDSAYKTVSYNDGTSEQIYWAFSFADEATVSLSGDVGSKTVNDRTHISYTRSNPNFMIAAGKNVIRDVQVIYTLPDGFTNHANNPLNIRLVNDTYVDSTVLLETPKNTGGSPIILENNCWYSGDTLWTGWQQNQALALYDGILRLDARATTYLLNLLYDIGAILKLEQSTDGGNSWTEETLSASVNIPIDAEVRLTVPASYASLVCAESLTSGVYAPIILSRSTGGETCEIRFTMNAMQIMLRATEQLTLYLDEGNIHVKNVNGENGFARYNGTAFVPYGGNLIVTQKNTTASCLNTLFIERDVDENTATLAMTGIVIRSNDAAVISDTVYVAPGVTAALHLLGENSIRNIRVPQNAAVTLLGNASSTTNLMSSPYFSGTTSDTDTARYYSLIGDYQSGAISMIGGTYVSYAVYNHQGGSAAGVGGSASVSSSSPMILQNITFRTSTTINCEIFAFPQGTIKVTDCNMDAKARDGGTLFSCANVLLDGEGNISFANQSDNGISAFSGASSTVELGGKVVVEDFYVTAANSFMSVKSGQNFIIFDEAQYLCHGSLILGSLTVKDNAKLSALGTTDLARAIAAKTINISGGEVTCGYLLVSGYVNAQTIGSDLIIAHATHSNIVSNGTLTVSGGTVTATGGKINVITKNDATGTQQTAGGVIGGSRGAQITVSGGTIKASVIGESEYLFGIYRSGIYALPDDYQTTATVDITDGDLTFGVLGGEFADVTLSENASVMLSAGSAIQGLSITLSDDVVVNMENGAAIGSDGSVITIEDRSKIQGANGGLGKIEADGGALTITDSASVHVSIVNLPNGDVTVSTTSRAFESNYSYNTGMELDADVGLFVDYGGSAEPTSADLIGTHAGDLAAENITVKSGSYVSTYRLGSNATMPNEGLLTLETESYIYTCVYGAFGSGSIAVDRQSGSVVNGKIQVSVSYDLNLGSSAEKIEDIMPADALYNYEPISGDVGEQLVLPIPERKGYRFDGWWYKGTTEADRTESNRQTYVLSNRATSTSLVAYWTPVNIWINQKDTAVGLDQWQSISYADETYILDFYIVNGQSSYAYLAQDRWQSVFGSGLLMADGTPQSVPPTLYDEYLAANGVYYADGLNDTEKATLRILENLATADDAIANRATLNFVSLKADWEAVQHTVVFDADDKNVVAFQYGNLIKPITNIGEGFQKAICYVGKTFVEGTYVEGERMPGIPIPIRKGYNFTMWKNGDFTLSYDDTTTLISEEITSLTAQYTAKKFRIYLYPVENTSNGTFAAGDHAELTAEMINGIPVYYFDGVFDQKIGVTLPETEILGYVHQGWEINLANGTTDLVDADTVIQWDSADVSLPSGFEVPVGYDGVLILTPAMKKTEITYDMHGGAWTANVTDTLQETYVHLTNTMMLPTVAYTEVNGVYTITNKTDAATNSVVRRGYRFLGWATDAQYSAWEGSAEPIEIYFSNGGAGELITLSDVLYADTTYHAIWKPCTYNTVLHAWDDASLQNDWNTNYLKEGSVTVTYSGSYTAVLVEGKNASLPAPDVQNTNLTYTPANGGDSASRMLLGWMFDGEANPVTDYYLKDGKANKEYARLVAMAMNHKEIFQDGDIFALPETIEDPGDGGEIHLYAVYRERSLIFVHCTPDGEETVKLIADFSVTRSGYVQSSTLLSDDDKEAIPTGYVLSGWYVNSRTPDTIRDYQWYGLEADNHPNHAEYYDSHNNTYVYRKDGSNTKGTFAVTYYQDVDPGYDIYVYSYYAPQLLEELTVYAQAGKALISADDTYIVPDAMKVTVATSGPQITYSVQTKGAFAEPDIQLVDRSIIDAWTGGDTWVVDGVTYYANKTFALEMVAKTGLATYTVPLTLTGDTEIENGAYITDDSKIQVLVYSTNRLANEKTLGHIIVTIHFPTLAEAELKLDVELARRAAVYELHLDANTPQYEDFGDITGWVNDVDASYSEDVMIRDFDFGSNAAVLPTLSLEGYVFKGWKDSNGTAVSDALHYAPEKDALTYLAETLTAVWKIDSFELTADENILANKTIAFKDQEGNPLTITPSNGVYRVPYKSSVQLDTRVGCEVNGYPEFVHGAALDADQTFIMPAESVQLTFDRIKVIDLWNSSVVIDDTTYQIDGFVAETWRGDYVFSGSANTVMIRTTNDLGTDNIKHDFAVNGIRSGSIQVENGGDSLTLNVIGNNSIEKLGDGGLNLTLTGPASAKLTVSPMNGAAIIGKEVMITGIAVDVNLTGTAHSAGNVATTAVQASDQLILNGAELNAICASPAATYVGTVLDCAEIRVLNGSVLTAKAEEGCPVSASASLVKRSASGVTVNASEISTEMKIECSAALTISNASTVTMNGGNANVTVSSISVSDTSELTASDATIKGDQTISVDANVFDRYGRHLDVKSGSVSVTDTGYTQDTRTENENRSYVLVGIAQDTDVSLNAPQNTVYLDGASLGELICVGDVDVRLLSDSAILNLSGDAASVSISNVLSGEIPKLTSNGNIKAHTLSIKNCEIDATGNVGSNGLVVGGKVGKVTLDNCKITAPIVGALGEKDTTFTLVELVDAPTVSGTLVIDHYRLAYLIDSSYSTAALPKVVRSTHTGSTVTYDPLIPADPTLANGISYFFFWYLMDLSSTPHPLTADALTGDVFSGFETIDSLRDTHVAWAVDTDSSDGTKTLNVYAWMNPRFEGSIVGGRHLNLILSDNTSVSVYTNGAWTARFTIDGTILANSSYKLTLSKAFPAGTMLTLADMTDLIPKYYYYECVGNETVISLSAFRVMGGTGSPSLLTESAGTLISDKLQLSADFSNAQNVSTVSDVSVELGMFINMTEIGDGKSLAYSLTTAPNAEITVNDHDLSISWSGDPATTDKLYLTAEVIPNTQTTVIPYDAVLTVNDVAGTRVGTDLWIFCLDNADAVLTDVVLPWEFDGLNEDTYTIKWRLSSAESNTNNVLDDILCETPYIHTVTVTEPFMSVTLFEIDGGSAASRVLKHKKAHEIEVTVNTTAANYFVSAEKQTVLGKFTAASGITYVPADSMIIFADSLEKGVYRICFSLDENDTISTQDNVYFTFIVE